MNDILVQFRTGTLSLKSELENELEHYNEIIEQLESEDIYVGDQYYQELLMTRSALQEALNTLEDYYIEENGFLTPLNESEE